MGAIKDSMKIVEMSEQAIYALKAIIDGLDLTSEDKEAINYGLNLITWLPKLLLEQRISIHRLQLMLFGKAAPIKQSKNSADKKTSSNKEVDGGELSSESDDSHEAANDEDLASSKAPATDNELEESGRGGRIPHTDYDAVEHHIAHDRLKSGDPCPE